MILSSGWACGGLVGGGFGGLVGSGLRGQRSPSVAAPITPAANFPKLKKRKELFEGKCGIKVEKKLGVRLAQLYTGYMALGYIARPTWLYSHWLYSHVYMAI